MRESRNTIGNKYPYRLTRGGRACLARLSRNTRRTCRCSQHHEASYPRRSKELQQTSDANLTTTAKESAWSCEACMHVMAIMMQCILSKLSGIGIPTHTYSSSCFTTRQFKCWLAWQRQDMGELHKIKWSGKPYLDNTQILHMLLLIDMQTTTTRHDVRCKQAYRWHINILHIFLIKIEISFD
jgi:hypothetical protein